MNFTFHQLKIFLEVKEQQNITRAARAMFMTQPALSIQLKKLQNQFEIPLIAYVGKKLYFTEFGEEVAIIAKQIIDEAEQLNFKSKEYKGLLTGTLKISSASTGKYVIPFFLSKFISDNPGIDLKLEVSNKTQVLQALENNEVDFAIVSTVPDRVNVNEEILLDNKLYLIGSKKEYDQSKPLIYRELGSATRAAMVKFFEEKQERKSLQLTSNEAVKQAVVAGLGYSILPLIGTRNQITNGKLHIIKMKGLPIITQWRLIWLKKKELSPISKAYLEHIQSEKDAIINQHFDWYSNYKD